MTKSQIPNKSQIPKSNYPIEFKIIDHPSDIGIEAYGKDLKGLFENAASGMMEIMFGSPKEYNPNLPVININVSADNIESLLIAWLSELLYLSDSKKIAIYAFEITKLTDKQLEAKALGDKISKSLTFIKAATYNQLEVRKEKTYWKAKVIFDV